MSFALKGVNPGDLWEHKARAWNLVWRAFQQQGCPNQDTENRCVFSKLTKRRGTTQGEEAKCSHRYQEIQECGVFGQEQAVQCDQLCGLLAREKAKPL